MYVVDIEYVVMLCFVVVVLGVQVLFQFVEVDLFVVYVCVGQFQVVEYCV